MHRGSTLYGIRPIRIFSISRRNMDRGRQSHFSRLTSRPSMMHRGSTLHWIRSIRIFWSFSWFLSFTFIFFLQRWHPSNSCQLIRRAGRRLMFVFWRWQLNRFHWSPSHTLPLPSNGMSVGLPSTPRLAIPLFFIIIILWKGSWGFRQGSFFNDGIKVDVAEVAREPCLIWWIHDGSEGIIHEIWIDGNLVRRAWKVDSTFFSRHAQVTSDATNFCWQKSLLTYKMQCLSVC